MIKALIFDADGTVLKREMYFSERYSRDFGVPLEKIMPLFRNEFGLCMTGKSDLKVELEKYLKDWNWSKSVDDLLEYWFKNERVLDRDVLASVAKLRANGVKCYLGTNNEKYRIADLKKNTELMNYFDGLFASCELGIKKPDPLFWAAILDQTDLAKDEILVLDNDGENVDSARTFGFNAERYTDFESYKNLISGLL